MRFDIGYKYMYYLLFYESKKEAAALRESLFKKPEQHAHSG